MINCDILEAVELVKNNDKKECNYYENEVPRMNFKNKRILFLSDSVSAFIHILKKNPILINYKNEFLKYYIELKLAFIKYNPYETYIRYFYSKDSDLFSYDSYYKISKYLDEKVRLFWDALYECVNYIGYKIRNSRLFYEKYIDNNVDLTKKEFENLKLNVNLIKIISEDKNVEYYDYVFGNYNNM